MVPIFVVLTQRKDTKIKNWCIFLSKHSESNSQDMNKIFTFCISLCFTSILCAQPGFLDPGFSGDGKLTINLSPTGNSFGTCVAVQPDGKIVLGGVTLPTNGDNDFGLARFHASGILDSTFGDNGIVRTNLNSKTEWLEDVAILPDGKIIAAGRSQEFANGGATVFALVCYNENGTLDNTFGIQGVKKTRLGLGSTPTCMVLQPDGKIIVAGYAYINNTSQEPAFARFLPNGGLDPAFSLDGKVLHDLGLFGSRVEAIALQPDGKIVATGNSRLDNTGTETDYFVARYLLDGTPDNTFGVNGVIHDKFSDESQRAYGQAILVQPNGQIIVGVYAYPNPDWGLVRFNADGTLDGSFGVDGKQSMQIPGKSCSLNSIAIQQDGKIISGGEAYAINPDDTDFAVARHHVDGSIDQTFGINGIQTNNAHHDDSIDFGAGMTLQADGKILITGRIRTSSWDRAGLVRYLTNLNVGVFNSPATGHSILIYPNPIVESANLQYTLVQEENVTIQLFDLKGQLLATYLDHQLQTAGEHTLPLVLRKGLPSGQYSVVMATAKGRMIVRILKK
jgi:uncharacterized delta-60 repeat protein